MRLAALAAFLGLAAVANAEDKNQQLYPGFLELSDENAEKGELRAFQHHEHSSRQKAGDGWRVVHSPPTLPGFPPRGGSYSTHPPPTTLPGRRHLVEGALRSAVLARRV